MLGTDSQVTRTIFKAQVQEEHIDKAQVQKEHIDKAQVQKEPLHSTG